MATDPAHPRRSCAFARRRAPAATIAVGLALLVVTWAVARPPAPSREGHTRAQTSVKAAHLRASTSARDPLQDLGARAARDAQVAPATVDGPLSIVASQRARRKARR